MPKYELLGALVGGHKKISTLDFKNKNALTSVAQCVGSPPAKLKGHLLDSWSGRTPEWLARFLVSGVCVRGSPSMFLSFSFFLPSPLSKNK